MTSYAQAIREFGCVTPKIKSDEEMGFLNKLRFWKKVGNRKTGVVRGKSCLLVYIE